MKRLCSLLLILFLCFSIIPPVNGYASVRINKTDLSMSVGDSFKLRIKGTEKTIHWSSSDRNIATVSSEGKVKAVDAGDATITASLGGKKYICRVTVLCFKLFQGENRNIKICIAGGSTSDGDCGPSPYLYKYLRDYAKSGELLDGAAFIDRGYSGTTTGYFIRNYLKATVADDADLYVINLGVNDIKRGNSTKKRLRSNLITIVNAILKNKKAHVILRTPNSLGTDDINQRYIVPYTFAQKYTDLLWNTYNGLKNHWSPDKVVVIDFMTRIFGRTCRKSSGNPLMKDVLHPSRLGQFYEAKLIAESVGVKEKPDASKCTKAKKENPSAPYILYPLYLDYASDKYKCIYKDIELGRISSSQMVLNNVSKSEVKLKMGDIIRFGNEGTVIYKGEPYKTQKNNKTNLTENAKKLMITHKFTPHQVTDFSTQNVWHVSVYRVN